jgi:hypothetical protein
VGRDSEYATTKDHGDRFWQRLALSALLHAASDGSRVADAAMGGDRVAVRALITAART